jgi:shikimate kinase
MNVFLIGYRGSGKTTVAVALAELLGWKCVDADAELERRAGKTIKQIFAEQGEAAFRDLEAAIATDLVSGDGQVIAWGGGVVLREENRQMLAGRGKIVWLQASPEALLRRIQGDATTAARRPDLTEQGGLAEIRTLLAERTPLYASCADFSVDAENTPPRKVAQQIIAEFGLPHTSLQE